MFFINGKNDKVSLHLVFVTLRFPYSGSQLDPIGKRNKAELRHALLVLADSGYFAGGW